MLSARDAGLALPTVAALMSPWCGITDTGDSTAILAGLDPTLAYRPHLKQAAAANAYFRLFRANGGGYLLPPG